MEVRIIRFDLNTLLIPAARSLAADRQEAAGGPVHPLRTALLACRIAPLVCLPEPDTAGVVSAALLLDNGVGPDAPPGSGAHCRVGEQNVRTLLPPAAAQALLYHHENYDASGLFGLRGQEIPIASQILRLADRIGRHMSLGSGYRQESVREDAIRHVKAFTGSLYSPEVSDAFLHLAQRSSFWYEAADSVAETALRMRLPRSGAERTYREIRRATRILMAIGHPSVQERGKAQPFLTDRLAKLAAYCRISEDLSQQMLIAADLLALLPSPVCTEGLRGIEGFENIVRWMENASVGGMGAGLDLPARLLSTLRAYHSLRKSRSGREPLSHAGALAVLRSEGCADPDVVDAIERCCRLEESLAG